MTYVDYSYKIFQALKKTDFENLDLNLDKGFDSFITTVSKDVSWQEMKNLYKKEIEEIIDENFSFFQGDLQMLRSVKEISYYEESISSYTCIYLFWLWQNNVNLSKNDLLKTVRAIFMGTVGYRLIDVHSDSKMLGQEAAVLGNLMIRIAEEFYSEVFDIKDIHKILNKYVAKYTEVEYLEKRNRWKSCPFEWEEAEKLGYKDAPLFSIFEVIFRYKGMEEDKLQALIDGLISSSAAIQLMDDLMDAKEDLSAGIETLVMSGFYEAYGKDTVITQEMIEAFLTQDKLLLLYNTVHHCFEKGRVKFTKYQDEILLLFLEVQNLKFNNHIELA